MAKVFIEETTLTAIGDAIRGKEGTTELVPVNDMATRISSIQTGSDPVIESLEITSNGTYTATDCDGYSPITVNVPQDGAPTDEDLTYDGNCQYLFAMAEWDWFIQKYGRRITIKDISLGSQMFNYSEVEEIPFQINVNNPTALTGMFESCYYLKVCPKVRGTLKWDTSTKMASMINYCHNLRDIEDLFTPEMIEGFSTVKITSSSSAPRIPFIESCHSLRKLPSWWYKFRLNPESTAYPRNSYCCIYYTYQNAYALDEIVNLPVWKCTAAATSNNFYSYLQCNRLKDLTFETNPDGTAIATEWKSQTIDLSQYVGYMNVTSHIHDYNSGITADKEVTNDATYQLLKNDPDWFTKEINYSRYNHDSAVNTINSLPDTSAYLATAGGTNTIKFYGNSGSKTDGGAINTLTEAEIAVAAAKGWTVTLV